MAVLSQYLTRTQRLIHDFGGRVWPQNDVIDNINVARRQLAAETGCIRLILPSGTGQVQTVIGQEVYPFSAYNAFAALTPGVASILAVRNISVVWGSTRPTLRYLPWGMFQAQLRAVQVAAPGPPSYWTQFAFGASGSVYFFPVPSQVQAMDWDTLCLPITLQQDADPDAIPDVWTDAVPYYAAYLCYSNMQRLEEAKAAFQVYSMFVKRASAFATPARIPQYY